MRDLGGRTLSPTTIHRLRVLGSVTVRREADPVASSRVTQPRQLALLCYLALARPRGLHARDTLIALLWRDHDDGRGRQALRNALHGLRQRLGANVIISAGDHLVGLDAAHVSCDAVDLERGTGDVVAGEDGATVEPLHGLHVAGAPEFDRWMTLERARLRELLARRPAPVPTIASPSRPRPHSPDASAMYARAHYLFLRTAHGGPAADLLLSRHYFERAFALDPTFAPALAGLANFYAVAARRRVLEPFQETFAQAIDLSRQALAMDDTLAVPHVHFGVKALYLDSDWSAAGREFATAVAKEPEYVEGHRFRGVLLGLMHRHDEALAEMELAAQLEPDIPQMISSLGAARLAAGDRDGAEAALRRTLTLDPRHLPARERLVRLLEDDGRFDEALAERLRPPALDGADAYRAALETGGVSAYRQLVRDALWEAAATLEARVLARPRGPVTADDVFSPPIVRLVALYARLGERKRARSWQLFGTAERPSLAPWFASIPELQ